MVDLLEIWCSILVAPSIPYFSTFLLPQKVIRLFNNKNETDLTFVVNIKSLYICFDIALKASANS